MHFLRCPIPQVDAKDNCHILSFYQPKYSLTLFAKVSFLKSGRLHPYSNMWFLPSFIYFLFLPTRWALSIMPLSVELQWTLTGLDWTSDWIKPVELDWTFLNFRLTLSHAPSPKDLIYPFEWTGRVEMNWTNAFLRMRFNFSFFLIRDEFGGVCLDLSLQVDTEEGVMGR